MWPWPNGGEGGWNPERGGWDPERGPGINSPVTIVDKGGGGCGPNAPTINLEQYTDYVLRKFEQNWNQGLQNGMIGFNGPMVYSIVNQVVTPPLKGIGTPTHDSMYTLVLGLNCKVLGAGAGTLTLTVGWTDPVAGSTTQDITLVLTATGSTSGGPTPIFVLAGTSVTVSISNSGAFNGAVYDAFVRLT